MKIFFFCGSLARGKDGVADYTVRLAAALIAKGHICRIVSLNDRDVIGHRHETYEVEGWDVPVRRLSAARSWNERAEESRRYLDKFKPDWISLQYVPYSYQRKGLCWGLVSLLSKVIPANCLVHLMFHETWIGFTRISPLRHRIVGNLQKQLVKGLVSRVRPVLVHTSNQLYQLQLGDEGIESSVLPIFSNIPRVETTTGWMTSKLAQLGVGGDERASWILLGVFGTIHRDFKPDEVLDRLLREAAVDAKRVALFGIGRGGALADSLDLTLKERFSGRLLFVHFGEQSTTAISEFLQELDYGMATMPVEYMDKSGTIAAMKEHGVSIIESHSIFFPEYDARLRQARELASPPRKGGFSVTEIAERMIADLERSADAM